MERHIKFTKSGESVCSRPDLLGQDYIYTDRLAKGDVSCPKCSSVLFTFNFNTKPLDSSIIASKHIKPSQMEYGSVFEKKLFRPDRMDSDIAFLYGLFLASLFFICLWVFWALV